MNILGDTGEQGKSPAVLFERGAFVTLDSKSLGSISLGRQNYDEYATAAAFDPFGGNNIGGWVAQGQYGSARFNNGITVETASFNGFGLTYQHVLVRSLVMQLKDQRSALVQITQMVTLLLL